MRRFSNNNKCNGQTASAKQADLDIKDVKCYENNINILIIKLISKEL